MQKDGESNKQDRAWRIVLGNDQDVLADALAEELFSEGSKPFERRIVVVPSVSVKDFLYHRFAFHSRLKIGAGVQVLPLNQAVMEILDGMPKMTQSLDPMQCEGQVLNHAWSLSKPANRKRIPSFVELSLAIEEKLHLFNRENEFPSLVEYLNCNDEDKRCKRIALLSDDLARCFSRYGLYGKEFLPRWLAQKGWQQAIWKGLFSEDSPWTFPLESLSNLGAEGFSGKIALFGFSYLSLAHLSFFSAVPASVYYLSPCAFYWQDFASDKQRLFAHRFFQKKGVKDSCLEELDAYMQQSHPLLANWGRLGREMLKSLDAFLLDEKEVYREVEEKCLLSCLKQSLLTLDETQELQADSSIQLHSATSKLREVEVLRDYLQTLLQEHHLRGDPIRPREILVACTDIPAYAPYIHMVFSDSGLSYAIEGVPLFSLSQSVKGFMQLIELPKENYALNSLLKLLRSPPLMQKWGFTLDAVNSFGKWFKLAQIKRRLKDHPNSWEEGLDRLIFGLALEAEGDFDFEVGPVSAIPPSEVDLFNRFLEFFNELKKDLACFAGKKSASDWLELFLRTIEKYFQIEWEKEPVFQEIKSLALSCRFLTEKEWNFESISRVLNHLCQKRSGKEGASKLEKISFVPLSSGNIQTARVLWCLGMDEGSFPRSDLSTSVCEMNKYKSGDYYPAKVDEDRFLFLELLSLAKDYLIFSYQRIHPEDAKQQRPSLLIDELDQYFQKRGMASGLMKMDHPGFAFDRSYFSDKSDFNVKKWSLSDFLAAKAHYFPHRIEPAFFSHKANRETAAPRLQETIIDIRQLKKLARNPIQFYFNETLKIYLKDQEDEEEEEFLISYLHRSVLRKKALKSPLADLIGKYRSEGKLPRGLFQEAAVKDLEEEWEDFLKELNGFNVPLDEIRSVRLCASCLKEESYLPPLKISLSGSRIVYITGQLDDITPKGLLAHAGSDLKSLIKVWPLYLIYRCLNASNRFLLLTKKGAQKEFELKDPAEALASYLEYFFLALQNPSPLMPAWAKIVLEGNEKELRAALSKESEDPYLNYLHRRHVSYDPKEVDELWNAPLKKAFAPLIDEYRNL